MAAALSDSEVAMQHGAEFRRCLVDLDVDGVMKLWGHVAPHLAGMTRSGALYSLHLARTQAKSIPLLMQLYSQRWLNERSLGSFLTGDKRGR